MKPSTDLFLLIHSLTKSEKGYFKKFAERHKKEGNNYLKLFDAINTQETYDEAAIEKKFKKEAFIKQLPFYKNYLYNLILKSMVAYYTDNTSAARISELIRRTEILMTKGMVVQAKKTLKEAKTLAEKYEKLFLILEITVLEKLLNQKVEPVFLNVVKKNFAIYDEQEKVLEKVKLMFANSNQYAKMYAYAFCNTKEVPAQYKVTEAMANAIVEKMEGDISNPHHSFESRRLLYAVTSLFYSASGDKRGKYNGVMKKLISHYDGNPDQLQERAGNYIDQLFNYTQSALVSGNIKDFKEARAKVLSLQELPQIANNEFQKLKPPVIVIHSNLHYYFLTCQFERVTEAINELNRGRIMEKIGPESDQLYGNYFYFIRTQIYFYVGCLLFYTGDYLKALKWLSPIWNNKDDKALTSEVYLSTIISIICHYEMDNITSMKYLINTVTKSVNRMAKYEDSEKVFCNYMVQLGACKTSAGKMELFKKMKTALAPYHTVLKEFDTFNLLLWIESKIQGKSAASVLKEHMKVQE